jgi:MFS family permease
MARLTERIRRGVPVTVVALGVVSFFTDMSSEMIYPLIPVFLVGSLGAGAAALGVIEGIAESAAALLKVVSGWWTDRVSKRKPFVLAGYGIAGAVRPLIGFVTAWPQVAAIRFTDRVGKGIRTSPRDALIADVTPVESRGAAYGLHRAMDNAGALVGPLIAAALLGLGLAIRSVFILAVIPAIVVIVVIVKWVKEPEPEEKPPGPQPSIWSHGHEMGSGYWWLLAAILVFTLGNSTDAFLLLRLNDAGVSAAWIAVLWAMLSGMKMIFSIVIGPMSDRYGRKRLQVAGWVLYAFVYLGMALVSSTAAVIGLFIVYGAYFGFTEPVERAWVAGLAPANLRGSAFGYYNAAIGIGALPASIVFGAIWVTVSPAAAFGFGAVLAGVAVLMLLRVPEQRSAPAS